MPTIVIGERMDRNNKTVTVTLAELGTERKLNYERGKQYVVPKAVLEVLEHSYEAPYVRVLDPHSEEPTVAELPDPEKMPEKQGQLDAMVKTFGKKTSAMGSITPSGTTT